MNMAPLNMCPWIHRGERERRSMWERERDAWRGKESVSKREAT